MFNHINGIRRMKKLELPRILLSLCALIVFFPQLSSINQNIPPPLSISSNYCQNYALLPVPFGISDNFYQMKRNDNSGIGSIVSTGHGIASSRLYGYFLPGFDTTSDYINEVNLIFGGWSQRACQLLDIPPPSI